MAYKYANVKAVYQMAMLGYRTKLNEALSKYFELSRIISSTESKLNETSDHEERKKLQKFIEVTKAQFELCDHNLSNLQRDISALEELHAEKNPEEKPLLDEGTKEATEKLASNTKTFSEIVKESQKLIRSTFEELKSFCETSLDSPDFEKDYKSKRDELEHLKRSLHNKMFNAWKKGEISKHEYIKFKYEYRAMDRNHQMFYQNTSEKIKAKVVESPVKENEPAKKEATVERPKLRPVAHPRRRTMERVKADMERKHPTETHPEEKVEAPKEEKAPEPAPVVSEPTSLVDQRRQLAKEMMQMQSLYGTVNNEEYQMRVSQLQALDAQILGKKVAKKTSKDFKYTKVLGGNICEVPKAYLEQCINYSESRKL